MWGFSWANPCNWSAQNIEFEPNLVFSSSLGWTHLKTHDANQLLNSKKCVQVHQVYLMQLYKQEFKIYIFLNKFGFIASTINSKLSFQILSALNQTRMDWSGLNRPKWIEMDLTMLKWT